MRIAVCLRGHIRTLGVVASVNRLREFNEVDTYLHSYDMVGYYANTEASKDFDYRKGTITINDNEVLQHSVQSLLQTKAAVFESYKDLEPTFANLGDSLFYNWLSKPGMPVVKAETLISQLHKLKQVCQMIDLSKEYDYVIVTRPDIQFNHILPPIEANVALVNNMHVNDGGLWINDLIVAGNVDTIQKLSKVYDLLPTALKQLEIENNWKVASCQHLLQSYLFRSTGIDLVAKSFDVQIIR